MEGSGWYFEKESFCFIHPVLTEFEEFNVNKGIVAAKLSLDFLHLLEFSVFCA